jgi:hypothetical protein
VRSRLIPREHPEPGQGVWHLGPVPIRAYALCIIAGIVAAVWIGERRWVARGGRPGGHPGPRGLGGAVRHRRRPALPRDHRPRALLRRGRAPVEALYVWRGGLGIWGAIALGALGVLDRRPADGDPAAAGRWTRWRRACSSPRRSAAGATGSTRSCSASPPTCRGRWRSTRSTGPPATRTVATFHPTFLYECIWNLGAFAVIWADRRFRLGHGRVLRALRDGLHRRPRLDRDAAHRPGRAQRRAGLRLQRLDLDRAVRRWRPSTSSGPSAPAVRSRSGGRTHSRRPKGSTTRATSTTPVASPSWPP